MLKHIAQYAIDGDGSFVSTMAKQQGHIPHHDDVPPSNSWEYYDYETIMGISNMSYRLPDGMCDDVSMCGSCPNDPLIWRLLRWVKIFLFQLARSKHGMTIAFGVVPLFVGLAVGIYAGRMWERNLQNSQQGQSKDDSKNRIRGNVNTSTLSWLSQSLQHATIILVMLSSKCIAFIISRFSTRVPENVATKTVDFQSVPSNNEKGAHSQQNNHDSSNNNCHQSRESGVELERVPKHIAVIMDGNRRYGKSKYKSATRGHADGGYKLRDMVHWCLEEAVRELTVYAFSTENWNRSQAEIDALMTIFCQQCEELRVESVRLQIVVRVLSTDTSLIPEHVKTKLKQLEDDTRGCQGNLILNVCLSYGGRGELVQACRRLASDCAQGLLAVEDITEAQFESRLLTHASPPIDVLLRTSGEVRISNFLLWQVAYSELFFLPKHWPDLEKEDLLEVIRSFANGRQRRFGA